MADLTTNQKVADYLKKTLSAAETAVLGDAIPAVTRYISLKTGRVFDVDQTDGDRYFDLPMRREANRMFGTYAAEAMGRDCSVRPGPGRYRDRRWPAP
jgi:hypothetical protein